MPETAALEPVITGDAGLAYLGKVGNWNHVVSDKQLAHLLF